MSLPKPPVTRQLLHTRRIECCGYHREDGLWDIEAYLIDTKSYSFPNKFRDSIQAGEPLHALGLRLTLDDNLLIHEATAIIDASPFAVCPEITPRFALLKGLQIATGWNRKVKNLLGDIKGCTHLVELLAPLATTAYQTIYGATKEKREQEMAEHPDKKPALLDSCHALDCNGVVVKTFFPRFYTGATDKYQD
ncbi:DUF2889 domain-containing protein [Beggiatoa leptomitoformis]|uniref:DUF2889 domain-containing protein n=1 Tax=Beggiatoa leptomitoformis TaxID=288004 RepID=A0A2N9YIF6_9GAMM|nr:DUF2889 domain-containing protein [Beggiatoa leptomitoformis]ALG67442.1 DUF2889 domain-containing protein [Beggiatoa leptomitoformis]AUI70341.1 DUF2889 domain-containing protein [Beggiatoa leptomitoformis]